MTNVQQATPTEIARRIEEALKDGARMVLEREYQSDYIPCDDALAAWRSRVDLPAAVTVKQIEDALRDYKQLDELLCCSGFDIYGQVGCGCQGVTLREEIAHRILSALTPATVDEHSDDQAVDRFAAAMKAKLAKARAKGRHGWDDPEECPIEYLVELLAGHILKHNSGNFEDIANLCMMLHQRGADPSILAATEQPSVKEAARVLLEYLPNYAMENAALESRACDDEGEFASLSDLLDFSGQNKAYTVVREALTAALRSLAGDE